MKNKIAKSLGAVTHTHTHTCNLVNKELNRLKIDQQNNLYLKMA